MRAVVRCDSLWRKCGGLDLAQSMMLKRRASLTSLYSKFHNSCSSSHNLNYLRSSSSSASNPHLIASAAALDISSTSASKATTHLVSLTRHYGRCYWELSKARLRFHFTPFSSFFALHYLFLSRYITIQI